MKGELGNGHDARVSRIEIRELSVEIWFEHVELYVPEAPPIFGVWACTAQLVFEAPEAVAASWHRMSLWVLDSELRVSGAIHGWEVLLERQEDVSLALEWSNGAKFSVTNAKSALLHLHPLRRTGEARDEG